MFLLSIYGYANKIPFDIVSVASLVKESGEFFPQRKFELHFSALQRLIDDVKLEPTCFFLNRNEPKGLKDVWGTSQIKEEHSDSIISGLAQGFVNISPSNISKLISLRELFKTQGARGKLADIGLGRGLPTLADDFLPRKDISGDIGEAPLVDSFRDFWNKNEREKLESLALLLALDEFEKLHSDLNYKRILRAFWKAQRNEFKVEGIDDLKTRLNELINNIYTIRKVEKTAQTDFGLMIVFDNDDEIHIKSMEGLKLLVGISFDEPSPNYMLSLYLQATLDEVETAVNNLLKESSEIGKSLSNLKDRASNLITDVKGNGEILSFIQDNVKNREH